MCVLMANSDKIATENFVKEFNSMFLNTISQTIVTNKFYKMSLGQKNTNQHLNATNKENFMSLNSHFTLQILTLWAYDFGCQM